MSNFNKGYCLIIVVLLLFNARAKLNLGLHREYFLSVQKMGSLGLFLPVLMIHYYSGKAIDPQPKHQMGEGFLKCKCYNNHDYQ